MLSWASNQLEKLSQAVAPPPTDAVSRYLYCVQQRDEDGAMGCLAEFDPLSTVIQPNKGTLPIHLACLHGMIRLIRRLLAIPGASVAVVDTMGNTPLHYAGMSSEGGNAVNVVRMLVTEYNASVVAKNANGQTPYDVSSLNGIRQYLLPLQLQQETQQALDNGGVGLPPGIDMGGLTINRPAVGPPPMGGMPPPAGTAQTTPPAAGMATSVPPVAPPPPGVLATPSPTQQHTYHRSQSMPSPSTDSKRPVPAPTSGNVEPKAEKYAFGGSSSAAILSSSKFKPDGFHSSSSDVNLQRKYGHVGAPNSGTAVPPPPSSGNSNGPIVSAPPSLNGPNPFAAGATATGRYGRYPVYHAAGPAGATPTMVPTPPRSGGVGYPYGAGAPAAAPSYTVFAPSSTAHAAAGTAPQMQQPHQPPVQEQQQYPNRPPIQEQQRQPQPQPQPSYPSTPSLATPTTPFMPPPPYQTQPQSTMSTPQYQQATPPYAANQQAAMPTPIHSSASGPTINTMSPASVQPSPPMTTPSSLPPAISTQAKGSAEDLFASPSPGSSPEKENNALTEPATTATETAAAAAAVPETVDNAVAEPGSSAARLFGSVPAQQQASSQDAPAQPTAVVTPTVPTEQPVMPVPENQASLSRPDLGAADFFGAASGPTDAAAAKPETEATPETTAVPQTVASQNTKGEPKESVAPEAADTADDLVEESLEEVSLMTPDATKEIANVQEEATQVTQQTAPASQAEAVFSSLVLPPPPFSSKQ